MNNNEYIPLRPNGTNSPTCAAEARDRPLPPELGPLLATLVEQKERIDADAKVIARLREELRTKCLAVADHSISRHRAGRSLKDIGRITQQQHPQETVAMAVMRVIARAEKAEAERDALREIVTVARDFVTVCQEDGHARNRLMPGEFDTLVDALTKAAP